MALGAALAGACNPSGRSGEGDVDGSVTPPVPDAAPGTPDASPTQNGPPYPDFPVNPIVVGSPAVDPATVFAAADQAGAIGPCLAEPQIGTLFPNGFLRPRFTLGAAGTMNLFEIRIHAEWETNDLVVYTTTPQWTMDADLWAKISLHLPGQPITVTVRGAQVSGTTVTSGPALGTSGEIQVAPVAATGSIVYWTTSGGTALKGFKVGEENVSVVLRPKNAGIADPGCLGCHSLTPDGKYLSFSWVVGSDGFAGQIDLREPLAADPNAVTARPPFLTATAQALLSRTAQHAPVYSGAHWQDGDHVAITMLQATTPSGAPTDIIWTDLEATSSAEGTGWGRITRGGDTGSAAAANFSHDGKTIVYVSGTGIDSGVRDRVGDIWTVPYNNRLGGPATPVAGASDPSINESYPSFSADDQLIAFNRTSTTCSTCQPSSYDNPTAEVFVVDVGGGAAVRLAANDPNQCGSTRTSPGVTNSWPKWSPGPVETRDGKTYYWLTFSSRRGSTGQPQIYVAPVVRTETGLVTYPAIYLWNQPASEANHTPAWDQLQIE